MNSMSSQKLGKLLPEVLLLLVRMYIYQGSVQIKYSMLSAGSLHFIYDGIPDIRNVAHCHVDLHILMIYLFFCLCAFFFYNKYKSKPLSLLLYGVQYSNYESFQMSLLYSSMVLSDEKKPAFAILWSIFLAQLILSS